MASDLRVPMTVVMDAFGVAITVTRPAPDDTPFAATGVWLPDVMEDVPIGGAFQRRDPRRIMAVDLDVVATLPRGSIVVAPPRLDTDVTRWKVDAFERVDGDHARVVLVGAPEVDL